MTKHNDTNASQSTPSATRGLLVRTGLKAGLEKGTVKFFNQTKGFGFIKVAGSGQEVFVHVSGLKDEIRENDSVVFDIQQGKKGPNAVNVKLS